jgi:hypothetical protein
MAPCGVGAGLWLDYQSSKELAESQNRLEMDVANCIAKIARCISITNINMPLHRVQPNYGL